MLQLRLSFASLPLALVLAACSHVAHAGGEGAQVTPDGRRRVNERAIEQSGARTAWDALQRTVPFFVFRTNSRGRPTRVEHAGAEKCRDANQEEGDRDERRRPGEPPMRQEAVPCERAIDRRRRSHPPTSARGSPPRPCA